ncbi:hypothetical protein Tco_1228238 [Tanacetum coccineum]
MDRKKVLAQLTCIGEAGLAFLDFGYVCSYAMHTVKYYGLFPVADVYRSCVLFSYQYRSFVKAMITKALLMHWRASDATEKEMDKPYFRNGCQEAARRPVQVARECTYPDFLKCQPLNFKGTEGIVGLTYWFDKMKSVYSISNCTVACQVKFATCTLQGNALT